MKRNCFCKHLINLIRNILTILFFFFTFMFQSCGASGGGGGKDCSPPCEGGKVCIEGVCIEMDSTDEDGAMDITFDDGLIISEVDGEISTENIDYGGENIDIPDISVEEIPALPDSDGDTISDRDEGNGLVDTDGDTFPDTMELDSDGDGIFDSVEAGDSNSLTPPVDSDRDGIPDFRDLDSDNDTIADSIEGDGDVDGDGIMNFRDIDSDGDFLNDGVEGTGDADSDTIPNFLDPDSDGDTISDSDEALQDDDEDGIPNFLDSDSDNDSVPDMVEAGDSDIATPPINCDGDVRENYRDSDSDNDGVADGDETYGGCPDPCNQDSDGDLVSDLIEVAYGSSPCDPSDNPLVRGDFVFLVPYRQSPQPPMDTLDFSTSLRQADVYFLVDTTGSMGGEITNLRNSLSTTIIPRVRATISDVWFGVGGFDDYPVNPYGYTGDRVFYQEQRMTVSSADAQSAVGRLAVHDGGDRPESQVPALWAVATGNGLGSYLPAQTGCLASEFGYPCFRSGSVPIVVLITDAPFHNDATGSDPYTGISPAPPGYSTMISAINSASIKVLGVNSGDSLSRSDLERLARDSGAVDRYGTPIVFNILPTGDGLGDQVVNAIVALATNVPIAISTRAVDDPADTVDATIFIEHIVPNTVGDPIIGCAGGLSASDTDGDGWFDTFTRVLPGTKVCFDIYVRMNTTVPPADHPQLFRATIEVIGDGITVLDTRVVYFLVPPEFQIQT